MGSPLPTRYRGNTTCRSEGLEHRPIPPIAAIVALAGTAKRMLIRSTSRRRQWSPVGTGQGSTDMVTVLIDVLLAFWVLAFGAMAVVPLILGGKRRDQPIAAVATKPALVEDQVLSILSSRPLPAGRLSPIVDRLPSHPPAEQRRAA